MSIGQGSINFNQNTPAPAATIANNGVSIDSGAVVLGNGGGDGSKPAQLLNNREIVTNGNEFALKDIEGPFTTLRALLTPGFIASDNNTNFKQSLLEPGKISIKNVQGAADKPELLFAVNSALNNVTIRNNAGTLEVIDPAAVICLAVDILNGAIKAGNLGAAGGAWKLGKKTAGAVALDPNNFVSVNIDGVAVKLAIVT